MNAAFSQWMQGWVSSGGLIDTIIIITLLETAILLAHYYTTKRGLMPRDYLFNVASGLCLMLAVRCALSGAAWYFLTVWLMAAGLVHIADMAIRLRQNPVAR